MVLALIGYNKLNTVHPNPVSQLRVASTPAQVANGERFARTCAGCHSSTGQLPLNGQDFLVLRAARRLAYSGHQI